ncbi:MAG: DNA repair protein RadA [Chitinophagaceae bacterium]
MSNSLKTVFFCKECGNETSKWQGKCPACGAWNTLVEEIVATGKKNSVAKNTVGYHFENPIPTKLSEIQESQHPRLLMCDVELDRILGGGLTLGSIVLVAGEPGIGKSTLFLQCALSIPEVKTLYVSGEESISQIHQRALRLGLRNDNFYLYTENNTPEILKEIRKLNPHWIIIDSIQTLQSPFIDASAGSIIQIKECTSALQKLAKQTGIPIILIGHITKEGNIAGPKILEHMVDTVLQFEGDKNHNYRILRTQKNRFGSTMELGIYEMKSNGLRPILNPSEILLTERAKSVSGVGVSVLMEGMRPLLVEVQALVTPSFYGTPQRTVTGVDTRKIQLLLAVLEKRCGFQFGNKDVFITLAGAIRTDDPGVDLSMVAALLSSLTDISIASKICFAGEVGLSGEIRAINKIEQRIKEAERMGFETIVCSKYNFKEIPKTTKIKILAFYQIQEMISELLG